MGAGLKRVAAQCGGITAIGDKGAVHYDEKGQRKDAEAKPARLRTTPAQLTPSSRINGMTLEEFRATLPEHNQQEGYVFMQLCFDVVKGAWLTQGQEPKVLSVDEVNAWAKTYALNYPKGDTCMSLLCGVREADLLARYDTIDLDHPAMIAKVAVGRGKAKATSTLMLDGFHRLRKAFLEQKPLKYLFLDEATAKLIQD